MTQATENGIDMAATVVALAAEATELQTRINVLRQELVALNERMKAISAAPQRLPSR
ncbi:hypothetical protein ABZ656_21935 [Streptomyces sp. NPDC007095]|jgi:uncharacterized protein YceH (UPF0502 family)|uniref:hypothetical protein n=1 Tax=Streptomyces sp. NPDC007095 TaxID=3154482 RepID=UPI000CAD4EF5